MVELSAFRTNRFENTKIRLLRYSNQRSVNQTENGSMYVFDYPNRSFDGNYELSLFTRKLFAVDIVYLLVDVGDAAENYSLRLFTVTDCRGAVLEYRRKYSETVSVRLLIENLQNYSAEM